MVRNRPFPYLVAIVSFILGIVAGVSLVGVLGLLLVNLLGNGGVVRWRPETPRVACSSNLKEIGLAARVYLGDHGVFPHTPGAGWDHLQLLLDGEYLDGPQVVVCPEGPDRASYRDSAGKFTLGPNTCSYLWARRAHTGDSPETAVLAACRLVHGSGENARRNVLFVGGTVKWVEEEDYQRHYARSLTAE